MKTETKEAAQLLFNALNEYEPVSEDEEELLQQLLEHFQKEVEKYGYLITG